MFGEAGSIWSKIAASVVAAAFFITLLVTDGFEVSPCQKVELMALEPINNNQKNLAKSFSAPLFQFGANLLGANLGDGTIAR